MCALKFQKSTLAFSLCLLIDDDVSSQPHDAMMIMDYLSETLIKIAIKCFLF